MGIRGNAFMDFVRTMTHEMKSRLSPSERPVFILIIFGD